MFSLEKILDWINIFGSGIFTQFISDAHKPVLPQPGYMLKNLYHLNQDASIDKSGWQQNLPVIYVIPVYKIAP